LKVDAGRRNLLQGLEILVAVDYCCEGGVFLSQLRMDFGNNPFGLGSSCSIKQFIHHPFLHPLHHWRRTACSSLWSPRHQHHRVQWGRAEPVAMCAISCIAQEIGGRRRVVVEGWQFRGILPCSTTPLELLPCLLNENTHLLPTTLADNVGICVCRLHPPNDRHLCLSPTCRQCQADRSATFC
jgi:hypothetical protein